MVARAAEQAVSVCQEKRDEIVRLSDAPSASTIHMMDDISDAICRVMDAAELCRSVHPEPARRRLSPAQARAWWRRRRNCTSET